MLRHLRSRTNARGLLSLIVERLGATIARGPTIIDRGEGNQVRIARGASLRAGRVELRGNDNIVDIGDGATLKNVSIEIHGDGHRLHLGPRTKVSQYARFILRDTGSAIEVGADTTFESVRIAALGGCSITIGDDCMFAYDIDVRNSDSHSILGQGGERINPDRSVRIADHVWVGASVSILAGSSIGRDCVVGMGSLVKGSFESRAVIAGVPATVVRRGHSWDRERL